jgi:NADH:ubiquinone oxidoreductase subunit B-like Fe-S oxidoreductase
VKYSGMKIVTRYFQVPTWKVTHSECFNSGGAFYNYYVLSVF